MVVLVNNRVPIDPRLGRVPEFDEASRYFPARRLRTAGMRPPRSKTWVVIPRLDQLQTPRCVGYCFEHWYAAEPIRHDKVVAAGADEWYGLAQKNDQWPGEEPSYSGSSGLGGAKAGVKLGIVESYHWCFSLEDYIDVLGYEGPICVGSNWYRRMFDPDPSGLVHVGGPLDGGHEWLLRGVDIRRERFIARNSWSVGWGIRGDFLISFEDFDRLRKEDADGVIPLEKRIQVA